MRDAKYTRDGEWSCDHFTGPGPITISDQLRLIKSGGAIVAFIPQWESHKHEAAEAFANARLIAAAPDFWDAHDTARDAILHCRGALEGEGLTNDQINAVLAEFDGAFFAAITKAIGSIA